MATLLGSTGRARGGVRIGNCSSTVRELRLIWVRVCMGGMVLGSDIRFPIFQPCSPTPEKRDGNRGFLLDRSSPFLDCPSRQTSFPRDTHVAYSPTAFVLQHLSPPPRGQTAQLRHTASGPRELRSSVTAAVACANRGHLFLSVIVG